MEKLIKIEKIDFEHLNVELIQNKSTKSFLPFYEELQKTEDPEYLSWSEIKYKSWIPKELSPIEFWALVKNKRKSSFHTVIKDANGRYFSWCKPYRYEKLLHELTLELSGKLFVPKNDEKLLARTVMEEAIASSQLEGAHTTRVVAKKMLLEKREPKTKAEKMIVNNYETMLAIQAEYKDRKLDEEMLRELHKKITKGTLSDQEQGNYRNPEDNIIIQPTDDITKISYIAPPIDFVKKEIQNFINFANDEGVFSSIFIHPVIKAIMLHFWIGLLHPFTDGNGRLARVLFYWYLLKHGYWTFAYLPISERIKKSAESYSWAYIYSEQDDNDLTYFIDYNLRQIILAKQDLLEYIERKKLEDDKLVNLLGKNYNFNHRQTKLLKFLYENKNERTNVSTHKTIYAVSKATAIHDLKELEEKGFLEKQKQGVNMFYYPTEKLSDLFKS